MAGWMSGWILMGWLRCEWFGLGLWGGMARRKEERVVGGDGDRGGGGGWWDGWGINDNMMDEVGGGTISTNEFGGFGRGMGRGKGKTDGDGEGGFWKDGKGERYPASCGWERTGTTTYNTYE